MSLEPDSSGLSHSVRGVRPGVSFGETMRLNRRLLVIIWPFLVIVVALMALAIASLDILTAGRGYVQGESQWAKGQKDAGHYLLRYAQTRNERDYERAMAGIRVTLGDRIAREEMDKPNPDYTRIKQGMLQGQNHPDDFDGAIRLYRNFRHMDDMQRVIALWNKADGYIADLQKVAEQIRELVLQNETDPTRFEPLIAQVLEYNELMTPLNNEFSETLGQAMRRAKGLLLVANISVAALLLPLGVLLSRRMLKHSESFERKLKVSEERFNLAIAGSNDGIWDWNLLSDDVYYSPRYKQLLGLADDELPNNRGAMLAGVHKDDRKLVLNALESHLKRRAPYDVEYRVLTRGNEVRWFRSRGQAVRTVQGDPIRMSGSISDVTDRKLAEAQLHAEKDRAQVTLESIGDAVVTTDSHGLIDYINPAAELLTGWKQSEAKGQSVEDVLRVIDEDTRNPPRESIATVIEKGRAIDFVETLSLLRRDGTELAIDLTAAPIRDRADVITGVVVVIQDVSRERQYAAKLTYQASHDALTGLINRREFENRVERALASAAEFQKQHAVLYLDLDQFKVVNDTCGHAAGDELMRQVSVLLQRHLRDGDTLARLGGDEFGVLLENCPPEPAKRIAEELRQTVMDFHFAWHDRLFNIGVSIGLVNFSDGLLTLADALSAADTACYMAKEKGRNRVQVYHPGDTELSLRQGEMEWVGRIHGALNENRLCLFTQEIADLNGTKETGRHFEVLVKMLDERGELVPPGAFIPAAERYNLMTSIDRWVINATLETLTRLYGPNRFGQINTCSINISGGSIGDEQFLEFIRDKLVQSGVPPQLICFEITETAAIANLAKATHFIHELKKLGCRFSLDDFGAGMSSFAYLKHLPVDFLKIDGSFVKDMVTDPIDHAIVRSINSIGHVMGKRTVAEFVENDAILAQLREIGVDFAQGYGVSKPKPFGIIDMKARNKSPQLSDPAVRKTAA